MTYFIYIHDLCIYILLRHEIMITIFLV